MWKQPLFWGGLMLCSHRVARAWLGQDESIASLGGASSSRLGIPACPCRGEALSWLSCYFFPSICEQMRGEKGTDDNILPSFTAGSKDEQLCFTRRVSAGSWQVVHGPQSMLAVLGSGWAVTLRAGGEGSSYPFISYMALESLPCNRSPRPAPRRCLEGSLQSQDSCKDPKVS